MYNGFQRGNDTKLRMLLQMQIYHGRFQLTMAQQGFYDMQISTHIKKVSGKTMPQCMGRKWLVFKPCFGHGAIDNNLHRAYMNRSFGLPAGR